MLKHTLIAATLLLAVGQSQLQAHNLPISEMMLVADDEYLHMEVVINATELTFFREMDVDRNGHVSLAETEDWGEQVSRRVVDCFDIRVDGQVVKVDVAGLVPNHNTHHLTIRAHYPVDVAEASVELTSRLAAITSSMVSSCPKTVLLFCPSTKDSVERPPQVSLPSVAR